MNNSRRAVYPETDYATYRLLPAFLLLRSNKHTGINTARDLKKNQFELIYKLNPS